LTFFQGQYASENSQKLNGDKLNDDAEEVEELVNQSVFHAQQIVMEVNSLAYSLDSGASPQAAIDAVQEAEAILAEIQGWDLAPSRKEAEDMAAKSADLLQRMKDFAQPVSNQTAALNDLRGQVNEFGSKLEDLQQHSQETFQKASDHDNLNLPLK